MFDKVGRSLSAALAATLALTVSAGRRSRSRSASSPRRNRSAGASIPQAVQLAADEINAKGGVDGG